ncbi:uncharacterized protein J3D65DRAFT_671388 [Phyllosticta citribraziliensis]|uniref:Uncharacterized protein n=1 Tax=Phyllosticta citribraziliensis TaxID=989973 RepID=A0ABR1L8Q3_9PEZI
MGPGQEHQSEAPWQIVLMGIGLPVVGLYFTFTESVERSWDIMFKYPMRLSQLDCVDDLPYGDRWIRELWLQTLCQNRCDVEPRSIAPGPGSDFDPQTLPPDSTPSSKEIKPSAPSFDGRTSFANGERLTGQAL